MSADWEELRETSFSPALFSMVHVVASTIDVICPEAVSAVSVERVAADSTPDRGWKGFAILRDRSEEPTSDGTIDPPQRWSIHGQRLYSRCLWVALDTKHGFPFIHRRRSCCGLEIDSLLRVRLVGCFVIIVSRIRPIDLTCQQSHRSRNNIRITAPFRVHLH